MEEYKEGEHLPLQGLIPLVTRIIEQMRAPQYTFKLSGNTQSICEQQCICQLVLLGITHRSSRLPQQCSKRSLLSVPLSGGKYAIHKFTTWKPCRRTNSTAGLQVPRDLQLGHDTTSSWMAPFMDGAQSPIPLRSWEWILSLHNGVQDL
jgi:hypothetical protein